MKIGKVPNELLEKLVFKQITKKRKEVLVRAGIGEDTAVIDFEDELCVISTDPITGATENLGALAVHISCNDVATRGAEPVALLLTILCPPKTSELELEEVMREAAEAASRVNVEIVGGHTEITDAVNRLVLSTTVLGRLKRKNLTSYKDIEVGDRVVLTKSLGIEGTHILATEKLDYLKSYMDIEALQKAKAMGDDLSVVKEGLIAQKHNVKYMHDITEGGVYGAIWEAAEAIGKGIDVIASDLPVQKQTLELCKALKIDFKRLISSGSMLMIVSEKDIAALLKELTEAGIKASEVGKVTNSGVFSVNGNKRIRIDPPGSDELFKALKK